MSASWFMVFTSLIWILGSKLILSNNLQRATLWVLDTCLIVGLLSFNYHFWSRLRCLPRCTTEIHCENNVWWWAHSPHHSIEQPSVFFRLSGPWLWRVAPVSWMLVCLGWTSLLVERSTSITLSQRLRAGTHSIRNPASRDMISDSVELCETAVCFLHIQKSGTNVLPPKIHKTPPKVDFESSISPAKSESWNSPSQHCLAVFPTWQYCLYSHLWWIYEINRFRRLSQALVHFCDGSCELIHWPQNVRSPNSCQVQACQDNLRANFWQLSNGL